jgi:hypothetical protein
MAATCMVTKRDWQQSIRGKSLKQTYKKQEKHNMFQVVLIDKK